MLSAAQRMLLGLITIEAIILWTTQQFRCDINSQEPISATYSQPTRIGLMGATYHVDTFYRYANRWEKTYTFKPGHSTKIHHFQAVILISPNTQFEDVITLLKDINGHYDEIIFRSGLKT